MVGNILTASDGTATHSYTYGDTDWKDLLTGFDRQAIIYDAIGNPTSYCNGTRWAMTWENGRSLATASDGTSSLSFAYDASGLRTSKTVNGVTYRYYYAGGKLMRMTWGTNTIDFFYDASGLPYAMKYNGTVYYYITNLQGDVMHIVNASGTVVASYDYDPYGKVISAVGSLANINPRGIVGTSTTRKPDSTISRADTMTRRSADLSMRIVMLPPGRTLLDTICSHIVAMILFLESTMMVRDGVLFC